MVVTMATNGQMGSSCFQINGCFASNFSGKPFYVCGFSISRTSFVSVGLNCRKGVRVNCGPINVELLERDFKFKPSFDEYLKAMELAKTVRDKKKGNDVRYKSKGKDNLREIDEKDVNLGEFDGNLDKRKASSVMEEDEFVKGNEVGAMVKRNLGGQKLQGRWLKDRLDGGSDAMDSKGHGHTESSFKRLKSGGQMSVSKESVGRLNGVVVEEVIKRKGSVQTRSNKNFKGDEYDGLDIERAAFKTFDESDGINDKPRVSRREMEERIQKLAMSLNGADVDMPEWMFSKMMRSAKIRFSDHSILRVILILGKLGNWRRVLQVIEWLQMCERFKSNRLRYIYTAALDALGRARRPVEALNVFHAMQQQMSSYPDMVAYHSIAITLGQAGHMKELFDVIDSMRSPPKKKFKPGVLGKWDPQLEPDIVIYNAILNACVRRKQWEGAFWVLQQLKQQGQLPSSTTYGLVMEVMLACGKYNLVHEFFRKAQKSSLPNALTYKVLVNTLWREGKTDEAILVIKDMERRGIVGSAAVYYDLARCLCSTGRCQEALFQVEKICKVANKPLVVTYTGLIQACLDSGHMQNGAFIFSHMQNFCSPNLVTCNVMMKAYLENGMFEEAKDLFQKMSEDGFQISSKPGHKTRVIPDTYTFNTLLDTCIAEKRWDDFEFFYKRMLRHGNHFNAKRHLRMILEASRAGKEELLETTWKHLAQTDRVPPPSLIKEMFLMKLEKDDHTAALSCITNHPTEELQAFSKTTWLNLLKENADRFQKNTLGHLINEVSMIIARSESPNPVYQNLVASCQEYTCSTQRYL